MMTPPCKSCTDRHIGCHGQCSKYLEFRADCDKANENRRRYNSAHFTVYKHKRRA